MKIYRIYKIVSELEWSPYTDDVMQVDNDVTIKYVDSLQKVDDFINPIEDKNQCAMKCHHCPLINLTKRQYNNGKHNILINTYCDEKDIEFDGNYVRCKNEKYMDLTEYHCEEIEVE